MPQLSTATTISLSPTQRPHNAYRVGGTTLGGADCHCRPVVDVGLWCADALSVDLEALSILLTDVGPHQVMALGNSIVSASSMPDSLKVGLRRFYDVTYECEDYEPSEIKGGPCECPECKGSVPVSELCKYRHPDIGEDARALGILRAELLVEYWDKPLALYQQESIRQGAKSRKEIMVSQSHEERQRKRELRDAKLSQYGIH